MLGQQQLQKQQQLLQQQQQQQQQPTSQPSSQQPAPTQQQQQPPQQQQVTFAVPGVPPSAQSSNAVPKIDTTMHHDLLQQQQSRMLDEIKEEPDDIIMVQQPPAKNDVMPIDTTKPTIIVQQMVATAESRNVVGRLSYHDDILYLLESGNVTIGRNSSTSTVNFHVGRSSFISRRHFEVLHDPNNQEFYVVVVSKNGIFVDETFNRRNTVPERLPAVCSFRFPSTDIRIDFESYLGLPEKRFSVPLGGVAGVQALRAEHQALMASTNNGPGGGNSGGFVPLKVKIPKVEKKSPQLSPTGTLSAANSCPTSPRQSYREFHSYTTVSGPGTSGASSSGYSNNGYAQDPLAPPPAGLLSAPPPPGSANEYEKPLYSYAQLIVQSISASPEKQLTLSGIYSFITKHYPYYRKEANKGWQNSIRHNLSLNRYFLKVERSQDEPGKGSFWRIDPNSETKLIDQSYRKRRQRGSQCFRTPYGLPRSAPASPSQLENSRESSPLHDIILQSAPGSPDRFQQPQAPQQQNPQQQQQQHMPTHQQQQQQQPAAHHLHQQHPNNNGGSSGGPSSGGGGSTQMWPE